jgi:hypothetical protein
MDCRLQRNWAYSVPGQELTTFTLGHMGVFPIQQRPERRNNGAIHWIGKRMPQIFAEVNALPEKPILVINHPTGVGISSYFSAVGLSAETGLSASPEWDENFAAIEVFNDSDLEANRKDSVAHWFALLNRGKNYTAIGASDSHHLVSAPVGYPRSCMTFGHDDPKKLTPDAISAAIRAGKVTVSGGLYVTVAGDGGASIGDTLTGSDQPVTVTVQAPSWLDASELEIFVDGDSVQKLPLGAPVISASGGKVWTQSVTFAAKKTQGRHWLVAHAKGPTDLAPLHPGRKVFGVSNPIYFK